MHSNLASLFPPRSDPTFHLPGYKDPYLKYADIYKSANAGLAIEKLNQLKTLEPSNTAIDKKLAEIYYLKNDFSKAADAYSRFAMGPTANEEDLVKYAFALFLNHDFAKSLEVANMGLKKNPRHAAFNRLAMYNNTDLKRFEEALKAADVSLMNVIRRIILIWTICITDICWKN